jgi:hypothetical protein
MIPNLKEFEEILTRTKQLNKEKDKLLRTLEMWVELGKQGIDSENVEGFIREKSYRNGEWYLGNKYNAVLLKNGEQQQLNPLVDVP